MLNFKNFLEISVRSCGGEGMRDCCCRIQKNVILILKKRLKKKQRETI